MKAFLRTRPNFELAEFSSKWNTNKYTCKHMYSANMSDFETLWQNRYIYLQTVNILSNAVTCMDITVRCKYEIIILNVNSNTKNVDSAKYNDKTVTYE